MTYLTHIIYLALIISVVVGAGNGTEEPLETLVQKLLPTNSCGIAKSPDRIVGGQRAYPGQFPWIVRIGYLVGKISIAFICGGSLITSRLAITAGHCFEPMEKFYFVRLAEKDMDEDITCIQHVCKWSQDIPVTNVIVHPNYSTSTHVNDIAIVKLKNQVTFSEFVQPICLPRGELLNLEHKGHATVAGWGVISSKTQRVAQVLKQVSLQFVEVNECNEHMGSINQASQICAGLGIGKDSCQGDSGGPFMKAYRLPDDTLKRSYLVGLVSYGPTNCGDGPGVYTNVGYFLRWILDGIALYSD